MVWLGSWSQKGVGGAYSNYRRYFLGYFLIRMYYQASSKITYLKTAHRDRAVGHHLITRCIISAMCTSPFVEPVITKSALTAQGFATAGDVDTDLESPCSSLLHTGPASLASYPHRWCWRVSGFSTDGTAEALTLGIELFSCYTETTQLESP